MSVQTFTIKLSAMAETSLILDAGYDAVLLASWNGNMDTSPLQTLKYGCSQHG